MKNNELLPEVLHAHKDLCPPDWSWDSRDNNWNGFHLWFIAKGEGYAVYQKKKYILKPGSCFILRMWEPFLANQNPEKPLFVCATYFNYFDEKKNSLAKNMTCVPERYREIPDIAFFQGLVEHCVDFHIAGKKEEANLWLQAVLSEVKRTDALLAIKTSFKKDYIVISKFCAEIEQELSKKYEIKELAKEAGYSTDHFIRTFKRFKGSTPKNYIVRSRIGAAKNMLLFSSYSIKEIADKLGYVDNYSFSKQFKKFEGKSPNMYRKSESAQ